VVNVPARFVQPGNDCDVCGDIFQPGDRAVVVVRVPDGSYDTICIKDWATMLAAVEIQLEQVDDDESGALRNILRDVSERFGAAMVR
jgi:hypothetical protein